MVLQLFCNHRRPKALGQRLLIVVLPGFLFHPPGISAAAAETFRSQPSAQSQWVCLGKDGKLGYKTLPAGDKIMDFSSAGYGGGGVKIPTVPVRATVRPSDADGAAAIQNAIDSVSKLPIVGGVRGAVLLKAGTFNCERALIINASGVVLRGSGTGRNGTTIRMTGSPHICISIYGSRSPGNSEAGEPTPISDAYVPSGATSVHVAGASDFKAGDTVLIRRPVTSAWIKFMDMDTLVRDGRKETWLADQSDTETERVIQEVSGDMITFDVPLTDSFDSKYHQAIRLSEVNDGWVRDVAIEDTVNSVNLGASARRVTVEKVSIKHRVATEGAAKPADFTAGGTQLLFDRCSATGSNIFYFVTGARATGPIVLLDCTFHGDGHIQPHARWATGLLVDGCRVPESGIDFMNRGEMGSGHGWTIGWAVAWNCVAKSYVIQQPPGSANWAIGCKGNMETRGMPFGHEPKLPEGIFDSEGRPVSPASLYLAQLRERLGPQALKNIGH